MKTQVCFEIKQKCMLASRGVVEEFVCRFQFDSNLKLRSDLSKVDFKLI